MSFRIDDDDDDDIEEEEEEEEASDYGDQSRYGHDDPDQEADAGGDEDDNGDDDEAEEDDDDDDDGDDEDEDDDDEDDEDDEDEDEDDDDDDDDDSDDEDEDEDEDEPMDVDKQPSQHLDGYSPLNYISRADARRSLFKPHRSLTTANAYNVTPTATCPHAAHVHSMAMSGDGSILLTGGSDGYVRKYDVYATMNGKNMLTQAAKSAYVDSVTKAGVMQRYWPNEEISSVKHESNTEDDLSQRKVSAVHSLAIQQDALWSLAGTQSGNINLTTVRHDPGTTHHVLRKHKGPVSAMALTNRDTELVSGGWDEAVHQWDLNTGQIVRSYPGLSGQISSISFRPLHPRESVTRRSASPLVSISISSDSRPRRDSVSKANVSLERRPSNASSTPTIDETSTPPPREPPPPHRSDSKDQEDVEMQLGSNKVKEEPQEENQTSANAVEGPSAEDLAFEAELQQELARDGAEPFSKAKDVQTADDADADADAEGDAEGDNDSLFGGGGSDADADDQASADADADADGEEDNDEDAEGEEEEEEDDQPLSSGRKPGPGAGLDLPGGGPSGGLTLPTHKTSKATPNGATVNGTVNGTSRSTTANQPTSTFNSRGAVDGLTAGRGFDADTSAFSNDLLLTTTLGGQAVLWDRRVPPAPASSSSSAGGVRALPLPPNTPPWCAQGIFSHDGERIYLGRRNETVEEWDMRALPSSENFYDSLHTSFTSRRRNVGLTRILRLPSSSGPVSSLSLMPNGKHLLTASFDNIRLWDLSLASPSSNLELIVDERVAADHAASLAARNAAGRGGIQNLPFRIIAGHHGAMVSDMLLDPTGTFLATASGDRGWLNGSTEVVLISEVRGA